LIIGDGMRSVIVLDVDEGSGEVLGNEKDMATHGVKALEGVKDGGEGVVISDVSRPRLTRTVPLSFGTCHREMLEWSNGVTCRLPILTLVLVDKRQHLDFPTLP